MKTKPVVAALLLAALAAPAAMAQPPAKAAPAARQCFFNSTVNGFRADGDKAVNVRVGVRDYYRLELFGICPDIDWTHQISLVSRGGNSICVGSDAEIIVPASGIGPQKCLVSSVRKLSEAEVAALPKGSKP